MLVQCAQNPGDLGAYSSILRVLCAIPGEIQGMRPNSLAEEGDGTRWGLTSATVTLLIPKPFPIGIGIGNFGDRYRQR